MLFSLIATLLVGAAVGVLIWAGYRTLGKKAPGYLIPMAVGLSMLTYTIWNEYAWYQRTVDSLPPDFHLVKAYGESRPWAPWTYIIPRTNRFVAIDTAKNRTNPKLKHVVLIETVLVKRDETPAKIQQVIDCQGHRFADLVSNQVFGSDGLPAGVQWNSGEDFPELMTAVCADSAGRS